jgi:Gas vesicle synthesis protein GvpL/GvpF
VAAKASRSQRPNAEGVSTPAVRAAGVRKEKGIYVYGILLKLLAAHHDEFTAALDQLEGRIEFRVKGRYIKDAVLGEVLSQNKQAARLREAIQGKDPDAARNARNELGQLVNEAVTARREEDMRALMQAMERLCVASVVREPTHEQPRRPAIADVITRPFWFWPR